MQLCDDPRMSQTPETLAAIAVQPPALTVDSVAAALGEQFNLAGDLTPLISERDQNFKLTSAQGDFVVKVVSRADTAELVDFQIAALKHLEQQGFDRVPRVVDTSGGSSCGEIEDRDGEILVLRVVTWVDGEVWRGPTLNEAAARNFGKSIAEFDKAISGFRHPGEDQPLLWDMRRAPELRSLVGHIDDLTVRSDVEDALTSFVDSVLPILERLPHQVIHNDLNGGNVLFEDNRLVGIIDFGDMLRAPRIIDVAIAAAYLRDPAQPLRLITPLMSGYRAHTELGQEERSILFDLVRARLCATITMLYWRMSERPADDPYRQKTIAEESGASDFLATLNQLGREEFTRQALPD